MKTAIGILLSVVAAFAADQTLPVSEPAAESRPALVKKLGSVTWDAANRKLIWVVLQGSVQNGKFLPTSAQRYEISPDDAVMAASGEKRPLADGEAASLDRLLHILSLYCAESAVWWDRRDDPPHGDNALPAGAGEPKIKPARTPDGPLDGRVRV